MRNGKHPQPLGAVATANILTVDLEDWFHICEVEEILPRRVWDYLPSTLVADTEVLLELFRKFHVHATFFVLGYVAARYPDLVRRIHGMGHEIGYHGWDHELVYRLTPHAFRHILRQGVECLSGIIGSRPIGFRAPQWSINDLNPWALEVLAEEGFLYDSSMAPLKFIGSESYPRHPHALNLPGGHLWEVPPLVLKTPLGNYPIGGGWGLRCMPYPIIRHRVSRLNLRNLPALFYFHPREFGYQGAAIHNLPFIKRFVLRAGIWNTREHLARLLADFKFVPIGASLGLDLPEGMLPYNQASVR
jgi:polysaccharide deacetylase family protein (PEP-CTERM system associated)